MKKSQAALEFLVTYGWALMIVLIMVGVIVYFGLLSPNNFISDSCDTGDELKCEDFGIYNNGVILQVRNNFGKDITVTKIDFSLGERGIPLAPLGPCSVGVVPNGRIFPLMCEFNLNEIPVDGEKKKINVIITYHRTPNGNLHTISGTVIAESQKQEISVLTCASYQAKCCYNVFTCPGENGEPAGDVNNGDFDYGPAKDCNDGSHTCWSRCSAFC